jgi:hypothetical protein
MIKVFQIEVDNAKYDEVNSAPNGWSDVAWGKTYLDLTMGRFGEGSNVSVMELIFEAIEFGLVKHTMTIDTGDLDRAYAIGNGVFEGPGDEAALTDHCRHKSASIGDIFISDRGEGAVVAYFGFDELRSEEVRDIEMLVPQNFEFAKEA